MYRPVATYSMYVHVGTRSYPDGATTLGESMFGNWYSVSWDVYVDMYITVSARAMQKGGTGVTRLYALIGTMYAHCSLITVAVPLHDKIM